MISAEESMARDEAVLVARAVGGDGPALGQLYDQFHERIFRYLLARSGRIEEAEDLTGEVFLRVVRNIQRYRSQGVPFSAWLFRIAHNVVASHHRANGRRPDVIPIDEDHAAVADPAVEAAVRADLRAVRAALVHLPKHQRAVVELRFFADLSVSETAAVLGKNDGLVRVLQHKGLRRLQQLLGQPGPKDVVADS